MLMDCNDCRKDEMKMDLIWNEIVTEEDISNLNNLYGYFEDSVIVSMNYISGNSINDEFVGDFHGNTVTTRLLLI